MSNVFKPGDLVISIYGDGAPGDTTNYTDNQASPITLEDISTTGIVGTELVLPQTASTANGMTESAISGEYGSSSEGSLQLSADGQSLTIAGYGIKASTFNAAEVGFSKSTPGGPYGSGALAQTTSLQNSMASTPVARVIADVRGDGTVDTTTALYGVDNTNNPRSAATVNGRSFYLSGQGVSGDTTQGVAYAVDGASSATAITTATDTRTAEIYNGNLYVSTDSKQKTGANKYTSNISVFAGEPTAAATPAILPGISQSVTLSNGDGNGVNGSSGAVDISPENYVFANATTLYVADGGAPKGGGLGDGGLQKWSLVNGAWQLDYTLTAGLNLTSNNSASGTTGLIGLTGAVTGTTVQLYATNATVGDTDPTFLYGITDTLGDTTAAQASGEAFTTLATAAPDTNIRGVAFAPSAEPTITGTHATADSAEAAVTPFSNVTIADINAAATDGVSITLTGGGGTLAGAGLTGSGTSYSLAAASPATITTELDALSFTPTNPNPGAAVSTTFTLLDTSSTGTTATDAGTVVTDTAASSPPTPPSTVPTPGPDSLTGSAGDDTIAALAGDDTINGVAGNDHLFGNQGNDVIADGDGNSTIAGGMDDDRITVGNGSNLLFGDEGADTITAGSGNSTVVGGTGNAMLDANDGADLITVGSGNDLVLGNGGADTINLGGGADTAFGGMGDDLITATGSGNDLLYGNEGSDTIRAGDGNNTIVGGSGNGAIDSVDGADLIVSGAGNDLIFGNGGDDTVAAGGGADTVLGGYGNDGILGNQGDDFILGNQGDDTLFGGQGNDTLVGGQGNDVLYGNQGDDVLYGDEGLNTFVFAPGDTDFRSGVSTGDAIMDFATGTDRIEFASGPAGTAANFGAAQTASTAFASVQALAQTLINGGDAYAFVADGADGFLFTNGGSGTAITDAVKLAGAGTAGSVKFTDIAHGALG